MTAFDFTALERSAVRAALLLRAGEPRIGRVELSALRSAYIKLAKADGLSDRMIVAAVPPPSVEEGMRAIGELANGIVERLEEQINTERAATEQAAADLGDKMARIGGRR